MITLTGMLDLNKEQAPAVTLRIGDTMRQTELTVDNSIDLTNCTAELYMVKPDSTFVIAACTITEDNSIIVSWPEQAAAVKGLGEYCIKITSNDPAYVYSARGPVWIDDHVITEDMIESVAEVNGYTFPDDFATKDEIPTPEEISADIIDDNVAADDKTWSSSKISAEIADSVKMVEGERVVGSFMGKTLYERVIVNDNLSFVVISSYHCYEILNTNLAVDNIWFCGGFVHDSGNDRLYVLPYDRYYSSIDKVIPEVYSTPTSVIAIITIPTSSGYALDKAMIIIRYTKSN